jgi:hypothetical protein
MRSSWSSCIGSKRPSSKRDHLVEKPPANCAMTALSVPLVNLQSLPGFLVRLHSPTTPHLYALSCAA